MCEGLDLCKVLCMCESLHCRFKSHYLGSYVEGAMFRTLHQGFWAMPGLEIKDWLRLHHRDKYHYQQTNEISKTSNKPTKQATTLAH
jgi:hypothetical protein